MDAEDGAEFLIDFLGSPVEWIDAAYVLDDCVEPFGPIHSCLRGRGRRGTRFRDSIEFIGRHPFLLGTYYIVKWNDERPPM